jgi:hypothetical protein
MLGEHRLVDARLLVETDLVGEVLQSIDVRKPFAVLSEQDEMTLAVEDLPAVLIEKSSVEVELNLLRVLLPLESEPLLGLTPLIERMDRVSLHAKECPYALLLPFEEEPTVTMAMTVIGQSDGAKSKLLGSRDNLFWSGDAIAQGERAMPVKV